MREELRRGGAVDRESAREGGSGRACECQRGAARQDEKDGGREGRTDSPDGSWKRDWALSVAVRKPGSGT